MDLTKRDKSPTGTAEEHPGAHVPTVCDYCSSVLKAFSGLQLDI